MMGELSESIPRNDFHVALKTESQVRINICNIIHATQIRASSLFQRGEDIFNQTTRFRSQTVDRSNVDSPPNEITVQTLDYFS